MKCTKCGAECREGVKFCTQCGAPLDSQGGRQEEQAPAAGVEEADTSEAKETVEIREKAETQETPETRETPATKETAEANQDMGWKYPVSGDDGKDEDAGQAPATAQTQTGPTNQASGGPIYQTSTEKQYQTSPGQPHQGQQPPSGSKPKKTILGIAIGVVVLVVVIAIAGLAYVKMSAKDPKQVVLDAFSSVYPKGAASPMEDLFGLKEFANVSMSTNRESGITMKLESCSDPTVNAVKGSGLRLGDKEDRTNHKSLLNMGVIYNGMDLADLNLYYGDKTLMGAIPQLSGKVFTLDLGDGLADRLKNSPTVGPFLDDNGIDADDVADYFNQAAAQYDNIGKDGKAPFDMKALLNRYKEGCKAQDNLKAAMVVTVADKASYTMNGKEVKCQGYDVKISKDSMIDFLRTSSDFFLQDETLKNDYLNRLEATVKMSEIFGVGTLDYDGISAREMQEMTYDQVKDEVDKMISSLDKSMNDVDMTVYVDHKGKLAAVKGSTSFTEDGSDEPDQEHMKVDFEFELQGGTYPTQNMKGSVKLTEDEDAMTIDLLKKGTYDGKKLTSGLSADVSITDEGKYHFTYSGTYDSSNGDYDLSAKVSDDKTKYLSLSAAGVVDKLEKGKSIHADIDSLKIEAMNNTMNIELSGEYYSRPLDGEVAPLEGTTMDVLSATEKDWTNVLMEMAFKALGLASQLGIPLY